MFSFNYGQAKFFSKLLLIALMGTFTVMCLAQFTGEGAGTQDDPYQVANATHLGEVRNFLGNENVFFRQTTDINLAGMNWEPIGPNTGANSFRGTYDGAGFEIRNMRAEGLAGTTFHRGLFGYAGVGAVLKNIHLVDMAYSCGHRGGGLAANTDGTTITNCSATGSITMNGNHRYGGLVAVATGATHISKSWADVDLEGTGHAGVIGGLVGELIGAGSITESYALGNIEYRGGGSADAGGLVGVLTNGEIANCYALGSVVSTQNLQNLGGLVGRSTRPVINSFSAGPVISSGNDVGGLIGHNTGQVTNSYWNLELSGQRESAGGEPLGIRAMLDRDSYEEWDFEDLWNMEAGSFPFLSWEGDEAREHNFPPPLPPGNLSARIGEDRDEIHLSWEEPGLVEPIGYYVYRNGERLNEELIDDDEFTDRNVDFWTPYNYNVTSVYLIDQMQVESGYSGSNRVVIDDFAGGDGTEETPFLIATAEHLRGIRYFLDAHFRQTENIELEGNWTPIGPTTQESFTGSFDGAGFEIIGLTTARAFYVGLFSYTDGATLNDIHLADMELFASHQSGGLVAIAQNTRIEYCSVRGSIDHSTNFYFGALVGRTQGNTSVHQCWADIEMTGNGRIYIGGLIGEHSATGAVSESYSIGTITTTNNHADLMMGGLIGRLTNGEVVNCYSTVRLTCPENNNQVGGLVGTNNNRPITNSFSTGLVTSIGNNVGGLVGISTGVVTNSYWNLETSGMAESAGGEGLTTTQMLRQGSFVGWDFGDDDEDGIWSQDDNSYPYLTWEGDEAGDHSIPSVFMPPSNVRSQIAQNRDEINITWNEPTMREPEGYNVYRNGERLNQQLINEEEFDDTNVEVWTWYTYTVTAVYQVGDQQEESNPSGASRIIIDDFAGGNGTAANPYLVETEAQLRGVTHILDAHYRQTANIDLSRQQWTPIGDNANRFEGSFDGNDFAITEMNFNNNSAYQGLFGATRNATLTNITLEDVNISGGQYTGALVGRADQSTINNCSSGGTVRGSSTGLGGLLGYLSGTANDSHSSADVIGTGDRVGGFVGDSWGNVNRCFATGDVEGRNRVGGFAGNDYNGSHNQVFATGNVEGVNEVGGLYGLIQTASYNDSYATGDVVGNDMVGGLVGHSAVVGTVNRGYSIGRVTGESNVGGFMGFINAGNPGAVNASYWNVRTSGQEQSVRGEPRDERHMTFPYSEDTYVGWNFGAVWEADQDELNGGYPYFTWQPLFMSPHPDVARNPNPAHNATNVSIDLDELRWSYVSNEAFTNPAGFRVYFNTTGQFGDDDDFEWVEWERGQVNYGNSDILPDEIDYLTTYYWKVVPTTVDPNDNRNSRDRRGYSYLRSEAMIRNDAENVPVWQFTTEIYPDPVAATNPQPEHEADNIPVALENVGWTYTIDPDHRNPLGFRVYMNTSGEFGEDDEFVWVPFSVQQSNYTTSNILPEQLEYAQTYYWKVVPTTNEPEGRSGNSRERRARSKGQRAWSRERGDAENVPVWSFSTATTEAYPLPATNPNPEHLATGISLGLTSVSWDYLSSEVFSDPAGFRVYMNTTGAFGQNAPYVWVDYVENQVTYNSSEIVPDFLDSSTTYYWRVIPTTNHPDDRADNKIRRQNDKTSQRQNPFLRGDAQNVSIWRFTTGTTVVEDEAIIPLVTELNGNYPNPFNPETTINFSLAEAGEVSIDVFNSRGQKVATLVDCYLEAGKHQVQWNGRDSNNQEVSSGIYFYRMRNGSFTSTNKMIMMK